jgi:N-acyl homoserine lactone hydrolase
MHKPEREQLQLPDISSDNWDEILSNPQDIAVEVFETGKLHISNRMFLNMRHANAVGLKREKVLVPVYCFLIHHSDRGDYLVDTGLDRSFQEDTHGNIRGPLRKVLWPLKSYQEKGQDIATQLRERDIDLKGVFFSHLHSDHASGMQNLTKDIVLVVAKGEPYHRYGPLFSQDSFAGVGVVHEIDFGPAQDIPPLGRCADIFGDGSFWAINTPGHRKGHQSFLVNGKERAVLLTGDACDIKLGFDNCVGPGFGSYNSKEAQRSLERMKAFIDAYPRVDVFFGHEVPRLQDPI